MTSDGRTILWIYAGTIAIWPIRHVVISWISRKLDILNPESPRVDPRDPSLPLVTAIIPAKDEEATLAGCLESVCNQDYPNLEIVIVDDRSTDRTGAIAADRARIDPRVRVMTIEQLPEGWTGKNHALVQAVTRARGEWLWFLDADTLHAPENLSIVFAYARARGALLASLLPEMRCETFWESVVQPVCSIALMQSFPLHQVNDPQSTKAFANGQYILIRRDVYDQVGGHRAVRDRFVEDIAMADRVKGLGLPIRVALTRGIGSTRMYDSLDQLILGWSRILYDALGRSVFRLVLPILDMLVFSQSAHLALGGALVLLALGIDQRFALVLLGLSLVHHVLAISVMRRVYRLSVPGSRHFGWYPLGNLVLDLVLFRSIWMCLTGRVTWRGTSYGPTLMREAIPEEPA